MRRKRSSFFLQTVLKYYYKNNCNFNPKICLVELANGQGWHYIEVLREFQNFTVSITNFAYLIPPNPAWGWESPFLCWVLRPWDKTKVNCWHKPLAGPWGSMCLSGKFEGTFPDFTPGIILTNSHFHSAMPHMTPTATLMSVWTHVSQP